MKLIFRTEFGEIEYEIDKAEAVDFVEYLAEKIQNESVVTVDLEGDDLAIDE
jgi:hypothetical protein